MLHNYTDNGTYTVTLTVTDDDNTTNNVSIQVIVNNTPPAANAGPDITAYTLQNITFNGSNSTDIDGNITTYFWNFTDGNSSLEIAYHIYDSAGVYNVTLTVTDNDGANDDDSTTVTVYLAGDVTHNNVVDVFDLAKFVVAWNKNVGDPKYNANADFDGDGHIGLVDFLRLVDNWEESC